MANQTEAKMLGRDPDQLTGHSFLEFVSVEQREEAWKRFRQKLSGEQVETIVHRQYVGRENQPLQTFSLDQRIRNEAGEVVGILTVLQDITELNELHQQNALRQQYAALAMLAAGIAHNFNNLLGTISMAGQMLSRQPVAGAKQLTNIIAESCQRGQVWSDRLLGFTGQAVMVRTGLVDPGEILRQSVAEARQEPLFDGVIISEAYEPTAAINIDPRLLVNVLRNLLTNAAEAFQRVPAAADQVPRIWVSIEAKEYLQKQSTVSQRTLPPGTYAKLVVEDNGPGIPAAIRDKVFVPFFSSEEFQKDGLGLPQALGLVESFGGGIKLGKVAQGTRFVLLIPLPKNTSGNLT
jgi:PAS domain S-box-containing protein